MHRLVAYPSNLTSLFPASVPVYVHPKCVCLCLSLQDGKTATMIALAGGHKGCLQLLISAGFDLLQQNEVGE